MSSVDKNLKFKIMRKLITVAVTIGWLSVGQVLAINATNIAAIKEALRTVPAAEMPAKAGDFVKAAKPQERTEATESVLRAALEINPSVAPIVVAAIAKAAPDMAPVAARVAAQLQPRLAGPIAKAAAATVPAQLRAIVTEVCRVLPQQYQTIGVATVEAVPGSGREVLQAVSATLPELKPQIDASLAGNTGMPASAATVLGSVRRPNITSPPTAIVLTPTTGASQGGPAIAPPLGPPPSTNINVKPLDSDPVQRGGRNYASP